MSRDAHTFSSETQFTTTNEQWSKLGLLIFFTLLTFDGALRKWFFPGAEQIIFILKDALLFGLAINVLSGSGLVSLRWMPSGLQLFLCSYAIWIFLGLLNPSLPNLLVGLWGVKAHLLYASLILIVPAAVSSIDELKVKLEKVYPWVCAPVCILALVQIGQGADSTINTQVRGGVEGISHFGQENLVRVTGSFSYIWGMATFLQFTSLLGLGLYLAGCRKPFFLFALLLIALSIPVTGSRGIVYIALVGAVLMLSLASMTKVLGFRQFIIAIVAMFTLMGVSFYLQAEVWDALSQRIGENQNEGISRILLPFVSVLHSFEIGGIGGFGPGTANLGAVALAGNQEPFSWFPSGAEFEEESERLFLETGLIGWFLSILVRVSLVIWSLRLTFRGTTQAVRIVGILAVPVMALGLYTGYGVFAPPYTMVGYFFIVGAMIVAQREQAAWIQTN